MPRAIRRPFPGCSCRARECAPLAAPSRAVGAQPARRTSTSHEARTPHDVAPPRLTPGGPSTYTAQKHREARHPRRRRPAVRGDLRSDTNSAPHGVIVGPDGAPWITDGGQNAIVRVDPKTRAVQRVAAAARTPSYANLNTLTFDRRARVWFTGQSGYLRPPRSRDRRHEGMEGAARARCLRHHDHAGRRRLLRVARGQSHRAHRRRDRQATVIEPPTKDQGARRVWSDSQRPHLGELLEHRAGRHVRPGRARVARMEAARATGRTRIRCGSTTRTRSGSPNGPPTRSSASIRSPRSSRLIRRTGPAPTCARCWAAPARHGAESGNAPGFPWSWSRQAPILSPGP